jgi:uncharacterized protein
MLRFDLSEILRTPGMRQVYTVSEPPYVDEDVEFVSPISGRITVTNTGTVLLIRGNIHTAVLLECSRCLSPVRAPIDAEVEEEFDLRIAEDARHHDKVIEILEDEAEPVFEDRVLKLDVLIRQAALLNAPLQPLCRPDCPGIAVKGVHTEEDDEAAFQKSPFGNLSKMLKDAQDAAQR